jgi:hypothetical protein
LVFDRLVVALDHALSATTCRIERSRSIGDAESLLRFVIRQERPSERLRIGSADSLVSEPDLDGASEKGKGVSAHLTPARNSSAGDERDGGMEAELTSCWCSGEQKYIQSLPFETQFEHLDEQLFPHTTQLPEVLFD